MHPRKVGKSTRRQIMQGVGRLALAAASVLWLAACNDDSNKQGPKSPGY
jgi:hypothetical protein